MGSHAVRELVDSAEGCRAAQPAAADGAAQLRGAGEVRGGGGVGRYSSG
jgi:hypothetical protein